MRSTYVPAIRYRLGLVARLLRFSVVCLVCCLFANQVRAAVFEVTSKSDRIDTNPGNGSCRTIPEFILTYRITSFLLADLFELFGPCTLRAAIQEANALPGPDTIIIPAGRYKITIPGHEENAAATGDLDITDDLIIIGLSVVETIIDGNSIDRIFDIFRPSIVSMSRLTLERGRTPRNPEEFLERWGGGIFTDGTLTLQDVRIKNNWASHWGSGGVYNLTGSMTLSDVIFDGNLKGGLWNRFGNVIMRNVDFYRTKERAAIHNDGSSSSLILSDSVISNNEAGAIVNEGSLELNNVTISGNTGVVVGNAGYFGLNAMTLTNVTISGNVNLTSSSIVSNGAGELHLRNVTIHNNTTPDIWPDSNLDGGAIFNFPAQDDARTTLQNTIVSSPTETGSCRRGFVSPGGRINEIVSLGHNIASDQTCEQFFRSEGDQNRANPDFGPLQNLGPLQNNGGRTKTHALLDGSPAIDAGSGCPPLDQRGASRFGAACDVGSYEKAGPPLTVAFANDRSADLSVIVVPPSGSDVRLSEIVRKKDPTIYIYISNAGPDRAAGIKLIVDLKGFKPDLKLVTKKQSCKITKDRLTCEIDAIQKRGRASVGFFATPMANATPIISTSIFGNQADPDITNNVTSLRLRMRKLARQKQ